MRRLRIAIVADLLEEGWPSMDLVAEMIVDRLRAEHSDQVDAELIRPALVRRALRMSATAPALMADRLLNRLRDYPRLAHRLAPRFDVFHVVDHSYAHLVHDLPSERTLVTCHDLDTFRCVLEPGLERRSAPFRAMTRRILDGLRAAGHVACDSAATRNGLVALAGIPRARTTVVHNGPHPACTPTSDAPADAEAARLLTGGSGIDLLHVGSTIPRKRVDVLLRIVAAVRRERPSVRLVRVGGPLTAAQRVLARELGVERAVVTLPVLDRTTLAAVYRRSAVLLLPSEREGFGLPVLEAMACGLPVIASDVQALREVGGRAAEYCEVEDVGRWAAVTLALLAEREQASSAWQARRAHGLERAAAFSWSRYAASLVPLYVGLAAPAAARAEAGTA